MKEWTQEQLEEAGYSIRNAKITNADLSMADYGCLTLDMTLEGYAWGCIYGGYVIGHGFLGASEFKGTESGTEYIMRVMDTVGVDKFNQLVGQYVRAAISNDKRVHIIGNIIKDKWFDSKSFFEDKGLET